MGDRYGRLEPGYAFDAIAFDRDPGDLGLFREPQPVQAVFKSGRTIVAPPDAGERGDARCAG